MIECHAWLDAETASAVPADHELVLNYQQRTRSRLLANSTTGVEIGLFLPRGRVLADGDRLQGQDGSVVLIRAEPEPLSLVNCTDPLLFARAAYHLGNRHVPLQITPQQLCYQRDHVLDGMLQGFGLDVTAVVAPFNPEPGAYHNHSHSVATPAAPFLRLSGHSHG